MHTYIKSDAPDLVVVAGVAAAVLNGGRALCLRRRQNKQSAAVPKDEGERLSSVSQALLKRGVRAERFRTSFISVSSPR